MLQGEITPAELNGFLDDLRRHSAESIDAYLETRQTEPKTMAIGRHVIAALMGDAVQGCRQVNVNKDKDWIAYVFQQMREGAPTLDAFINGNSDVKFITFNFDTIIEDRFRVLLGDTYFLHRLE